MDLDWDDLRLVAVVRAVGTTAAAARRLGIDQTTAARRLARLERRVGLALFDRIERRLVARPVVEALTEELDRIAASVAWIAARFDDERAALGGRVVVSTVDLVASRLLAPALGRFRADHPGVRLEFDVDDANVSLAAREADIAVRLGRPGEDTALTRRIGALSFGFYGARDAADPGALPLAAYGAALDHVGESRWLAERFPDAPIVVRSDRAAVLAEAAAAGHRAVLPRLLGDGDPRLVRLDGDDPPPARELWLLVHPERRRDRAVAAVVGWIEASVAARAAVG